MKKTRDFRDHHRARPSRAKARDRSLRSIAKRHGMTVPAYVRDLIDREIETERKLEKLMPGQTLRRVLVRR